MSKRRENPEMQKCMVELREPEKLTFGRSSPSQCLEIWLAAGFSRRPSGVWIHRKYPASTPVQKVSE